MEEGRGGGGMTVEVKVMLLLAMAVFVPLVPLFSLFLSSANQVYDPREGRTLALSASLTLERTQ